MATGRRPNLREACSLLAALTLFGITLSLVPDVLAGKTLPSRSLSCCRV
jgi:multicomponent Na+:H+ antiporter subunit D